MSDVPSLGLTWEGSLVSSDQRERNFTCTTTTDGPDGTGMKNPRVSSPLCSKQYRQRSVPKYSVVRNNNNKNSKLEYTIFLSVQKKRIDSWQKSLRMEGWCRQQQTLQHRGCPGEQEHGGWGKKAGLWRRRTGPQEAGGSRPGPEGNTSPLGGWLREGERRGPHRLLSQVRGVLAWWRMCPGRDREQQALTALLKFC